MQRVLPVRRSVRLALVALCVAGLLALTGTAFAGADGATVSTGIRCTVFDGNGQMVKVAGRSQRVMARNADGNSKYTCTVRHVTPPPDGEAVEWNYENTGKLCSTLFGLTRDWREVVTPSGQATLSCFINPSGP